MRQPIPLVPFAGLILLVTLLAYWPGLGGPIFFDDKPALTDNLLVQIDGATFDQWRSAALSSDTGPLHRPIAMLSFAANHALQGQFSIFGLKVGNLGIHLLTGVLLYFLFLAILDALQVVDDRHTRRLVALTGAAVWLLHPLNVSTVLYSVQRMAQLAGLFTLAGLLIFTRNRQRWAQRGARRGELIATVLWLLLFTVFAALSKENGALLPWLVIVLEVCVFRGVWAGRPNRLLSRGGWFLLLSPLLLVIGVLVAAPEILTAGYAGREFTLDQRLLTQSRLLWRYLGWLCVPNIYDMGFQHDDILVSTGLFTPLTTFLSLLAWVLTLVVFFLLRRRYPVLMLTLFFFLVGHSMESSVLPLEMVYEHRNYLPGTMVCLALASLLVLPLRASKTIAVGYSVSGALIVLALLLLVRVYTWSDELTLSRTNLIQHPDSSRSNYFYANALLRQYRRAEQFGLSEEEKSEYLLLSRHHFERMYQANPRDVAALVLLFYLDSYYFTDLQQQVDWLGLLESLMQDRALQPSDWNALSTLFEIFASDPELVGDDRVMGLLDRLAQRYPRSVHVMRYRYQYLSARGAPPAKLVPLLHRAQQLAPQASWVYYALLREYDRDQDVAGMYEYAGRWLQHDRLRRHVQEIKSLFGDVTMEAVGDGK